MSSEQPNEQRQPEAYTVFYDGDCPLCAAEIKHLEPRIDTAEAVFVDISSPGFDASQVGVSMQDLMQRLHARTTNGEWESGMDVTRRTYALAGYGWLMAWTAWPVVRPLSDRAYGLFARYRLPLGDAIKRCFGTPRR